MTKSLNTTTLVFSILYSVGFVLYIFGLSTAAVSIINGSSSNSGLGILGFGLIIFVIGLVGQFICGILQIIKHNENEKAGLMLAAGILHIIGIPLVPTIFTAIVKNH